MFRWKLIVPAVVLLGGFLVCSTASFGKAEYSKATKKACTYCHEKTVGDKAVMAKNMTDAGKFYAEHKSLDGYQAK